MNINHTTTLLASAALAALLAGCDLTMLPEDAVTPQQYFQSASDLELWTNQFYTMFESPESAVGVNADDMIDKSMGAVIEGTRSAASESWSWSQLRRLNEYFANAGNCTDAAVRARYDGAAHFFRAYFYFVKVRKYGDVPWYDHVLASDEADELYKARDPRETVMAHVLDDLRQAIALLPDDDEATRLTRWAALAFATRFALYEGTFRKYRAINGWQKYLQFADSCGNVFIAESPYRLASSGPTPYRDLFVADRADQTEVVLAEAFDFENLQLAQGVQFNIANMQFGFTRRFMNHYLMADGTRFTDLPGYQTMTYTEETRNRDPRMEQTVLCPGYIQKGATEVTGNTLSAYCGYTPIKFVADASHDGAAKGTADWPLMRAAEVYLNYAEAKAELGTLAQADLDRSLNRCRERAKMPALDMAAANANPDPFLAACYPNVAQGANTGVILEIRRERTVEMVMEGQRQWDLFRWKEGKQMLNAHVKYLGLYIPGPGTYDYDGDGVDDIEIYADKATSRCSVKKRLNKDIYLTEGTSGYLIGYPNVTYGTDWSEERDYLWPIPADQRVLTNGALTQNPGWEDGLAF